MSPMDLYQSAITEGALNKHKSHESSVCFVSVCAYAYARKTVVGSSFMNGKRAFVISSPYLVTVLYREKALFM